MSAAAIGILQRLTKEWASPSILTEMLRIIAVSGHMGRWPLCTRNKMKQMGQPMCPCLNCRGINRMSEVEGDGAGEKQTNRNRGMMME